MPEAIYRMIRYARVWYLPPEPMYLLFFLSMIYSLIVHEQYIYYRSCIHIAGNNCNYTLVKHNISSTCSGSQSEDDILAYASYLRLTSSIVSLPTLVVCIIFGPLSDHLGRKFIFSLPIVGLLLNNVICILIEILNLHPYALLVANAISGFTGGGALFFTAVESYTVDITSVKYRTMRMGIAHTALSLASFIGNFSGGIILENLGFVDAFLIIIILLLTTLLYSIVLPESVCKPESTDKTTVKQLLFKIMKPFRIICKNESPFKFITVLIACEFLLGNLFANYSIFTLYALSKPLCWLPHLVGWYFAFTSLGYTIGIYLFLPLIIKFRVSDYLVLMIAAIDNIITYILIGSSHIKFVLMIVVPIVGCLNVISGPSGKSALSKLIDKKEAGSLFGLTSTMGVTTNIIVSSFYNAIYPTLRSYYEGLCFYLIAATSIAPLILSGFLFINNRMCSKEARENAERNDKIMQIGNETQALVPTSITII